MTSLTCDSASPLFLSGIANLAKRKPMFCMKQERGVIHG